MKNLLKGKVIGALLVAVFILGSTVVLGFAMSAANESTDNSIADIVERNLDTITEPSPYSNPYAYIDAHKAEYNEIVAHRDDALQYMFSLFEKGDQTGLRGWIMAVACCEILGEDTEFANATVDTGQKWYDTYILTENEADYGIPDYQVNKNGQTYGSGLHDDYDMIEKPDLIHAIGIDGIEGYVLSADLYGTGPLHKPQNGDEVFEYMEQMDELIKDAQARGDAYMYTIPLYDSDGMTVIGEFGIPIPIEFSQPLQSGGMNEQPMNIANNNQSLYITYGDKVVDDITILIGEFVQLRINGKGVDNEISEDIIIESSDQSIFSVVISKQNGNDVMLTGVGRGRGILTAIVDGIETTCIVRVR